MTIVLFLLLFLLGGIGSGWFGRRFLRVTVPFLTLICFLSALYLALLPRSISPSPPSSPPLLTNDWVLIAIHVGPLVLAAILGYWIKIGIFFPLMFCGYLLSAEFSLLLDHFIFGRRIFTSSLSKTILNLALTHSPSNQIQITRWIHLTKFLYFARMFGFIQWPVSILLIIVNCLIGIVVVAIYLKFPHKMTIFAQSICGNWLFVYATVEIIGQIESCCLKGSGGKKGRSIFPFQSVGWISCLLFLGCFVLALFSSWIQHKGEEEVEKEVGKEDRWEIFSLEES